MKERDQCPDMYEAYLYFLTFHLEYPESFAVVHRVSYVLSRGR
jgi:hypothetical protein